MLVVSRKDGQGAVITTADGQRILVTISDVAGNRVRLGIQAPKNVRILRSELDNQWPLGLPGIDPTDPANRGGLSDAK